MPTKSFRVSALFFMEEAISVVSMISRASLVRGAPLGVEMEMKAGSLAPMSTE